MKNLTAAQAAHLEKLAIAVNEAKTAGAEQKARDRMNRRMERLMDGGVDPEAIIALVHG